MLITPLFPQPPQLESPFVNIFLAIVILPPPSTPSDQRLRRARGVMLSAKQTKSDWSAATKPFIAEFSFVVFETHFGLGYFRGYRRLGLGLGRRSSGVVGDALRQYLSLQTRMSFACMMHREKYECVCLLLFVPTPTGASPRCVRDTTRF